MDEIGHVVRVDSRRRIEFSGTGIHEELLSPTLSGELLMILSVFSPLAGTDDQARKRKGEEAGYVQSGRLDLTVGDRSFRLKSGDSFSIQGDDTHSVRNPSATEEALVVWVITPPNY